MSKHTLIPMIAQPIVSIEGNQNAIVAMEWLARPQDSLSDFFNVTDVEKLWIREEGCIRSALEYKSSFPRMLNISLSSLPRLVESDLSWEGGIEITEWGLISYSKRKLQEFVDRLRDRKLSVFLDDINEQVWEFWSGIDVDGYKMELQELKQSKRLLEQMMKTGKTVVAERIETLHDLSIVKEYGLRLGQGYYFDGILSA